MMFRFLGVGVYVNHPIHIGPDFEHYPVGRCRVTGISLYKFAILLWATWDWRHQAKKR
jgi:hypothetical protein